MSDDTRINAERIMSRSFEQPVRLGAPSALRTGDRFSVTRFSVANSSTALPDSVVVKRVSRFVVDDGADGDDDVLSDLFNEWAALQFLDQITGDDKLAPRFFGGQQREGIIIMEDLGTSIGVNDLLWKSNAKEAEEGLNRLAATLGRMHALTVGRRDHYEAMRTQLGPMEIDSRDSVHRWVAESLTQACASVGVPPIGGLDDDISRIVEFATSMGPFSAFVHSDPFPGNDVANGDKCMLVDFEYGGFKHALIDGCLGRFHFPTCWRINRLPDSVVAGMEETYRTELADACSQAVDDTAFYQALAEACCYWVIHLFSWVTDDVLMCESKGGTENWQKKMLLHLQIVTSVTREFGHLETFGQIVREIATKLRDHWPQEAQNVPLYPAFRSNWDG